MAKKKKKKNGIVKKIYWGVSIVFMVFIIVSIILFVTGVWEIPFMTSQQITDTTKIIETLKLGQTINTPEITCKFTMGESTACIGEDVTSTIQDGSLKRCVVAYNYENTGWKIYNVEVLDIDGFVSVTDSAGVAGTYIWTALCGHFEGEDFIEECRTNDETIEIISCEEDCTETDGGNVITVPGITTFDGIGYMDQCIATDSRMVHEYFCEGDTLGEGNFMCPDGSACYQTRSGAYCLASDGGDEVGDIIDNSGGSGGGSVMPGTSDLTDGITVDWVPGGQFILGVRIFRDWDYMAQQDPDCINTVFPEVMEWTFFDSNGLRWQVYDEFPTTETVEICPTIYHQDAPWKFEVRNSKDYCDVAYTWSLETFICEGG